MGIAGLIVAAGRGERFGGGTAKQFRDLGGRAVIAHALETFLAHRAVDAVQVVIHSADRALYDAAIGAFGSGALLPPVTGSATRSGSVLAGLAGEATTYGTLAGEAVAYVPVRLAPQLTLALRAGAQHRVGDFPFFDAAVIGDAGTLRGYRRERFAGRTAVSGGAELRTKLFDVDAYVLPLQVGALGFVDAGRVWADDPAPAFDDNGPAGYQLGYGGGLWFGLLDRAVLNLTVGASDESTLVTVGLGFAY